MIELTIETETEEEVDTELNFPLRLEGVQENMAQVILLVEAGTGRLLEGVGVALHGQEATGTGGVAPAQCDEAGSVALHRQCAEGTRKS